MEPANEQSELRQSAEDLPRRAAALVEAENLLPPGSRVVVGVSGGADSVALLALLRRLSGPRQLSLTIAHLDHAIRADSAEDARWVAALAESWGLPHVIERRDVPAEAARAGLGLEEAARNARYEFLSDVASRAGSAVVAVGHHADDNVETILQRIVRGTHLRGLAGMAPCRPLGDSGCRLVRPLLGCRREEIERFCREEGLSWRTDSTNADPAHRRNLIRHRLLPMLREQLNPRADEAILRLAAAARETDDLLDGLAREALKDARLREGDGSVSLDRRVLAGLAEPLRSVLLRQVLEDLEAPLKKVGREALGRLSDLSTRENDALALAGGLEARCVGSELRIGRPTNRREAVDAGPVELRCPGRTPLPGGGEVLCEELRPAAGAFEEHRSRHPGGVEWLDADRVMGRLVCRPRREGDRFRPLGLAGTQTVGDFLSGAGVDPDQREAVRCLCDEAGIVYVAPLRIDHRVRVTAATRRVWRITARTGVRL